MEPRAKPRRLIDPAVATGLFALALVLRLTKLSLDLDITESWNFHIARTLGLGPFSVFPTLPRFSHFVFRPVFALFFWPWAQLGFVPFRAASCVVGALVPVLVFFVCLELELSTLAAAFGALFVAVHPLLILYSVKVWPDMLGTVLMLAALLGFLRGNRKLLFVALTACLLTKESFVVVNLTLLFVCVTTKRKQLIAPILLSTVPLVVVSALAIGVFGGMSQGWGTDNPGWHFYESMGLGIYVLPALVVLVLADRRLELSLACAYPVFFVGWWTLRGRGVNPWYAVAPLVLSAVAYASAMQALSTWRLGKPRLIASLVLAATVGILFFHLGVPRELGPRNPLRFDWSAQRPFDESTGAVIRLLDERAPKTILLLDCYWGYAYFPFYAEGRTNTFLKSAKNPEQELRLKLLGSDLLIMEHTRANPMWEARLKGCRILETRKFSVYEKLDRCLAS